MDDLASCVFFKVFVCWWNITIWPSSKAVMDCSEVSWSVWLWSRSRVVVLDYGCCWKLPVLNERLSIREYHQSYHSEWHINRHIDFIVKQRLCRNVWLSESSRAPFSACRRSFCAPKLTKFIISFISCLVPFWTSRGTPLPIFTRSAPPSLGANLPPEL